MKKILFGGKRTFALLVISFSAHAVWGAPSVQTVEVFPNPLALGRSFTITASASAEVTEATATVDLRPAAVRLLRIPLVRDGAVWKGNGSVPPDVSLPSGFAAKVKVLGFDAARKPSEKTVSVNVTAQLSASFAGGVLTVTGDDLDNTLFVGADATGNLLVNDGAIAIQGGTPTIHNTSLIQIFGFGGNDTIFINDNGSMPPAHLFGGEGNDTLTGSASADLLDGGPGNDTLSGRGRNDQLFGGPGDDTLIGGQGQDVMSGGPGNDTMVWNPGDGSDIVEGEGGNDTLLFNGANIAEIVDILANGRRLLFKRNIASITMDCGGIEKVVFRALGGADLVRVGDLSGTGVNEVVVDLASSLGTPDGAADQVSVDGTDHADVVTVIESETGAEIRGLPALVRVLGADVDQDKILINGRGDSDIVDFIGSEDNESVSFSADGSLLRYFHTPTTVAVECAEVEQVNFRALGGSDTVVVNDLTGTPIRTVGIDLTGEGGTVDGQPDTVIINGTPGDDEIRISEAVVGLSVEGLTARVAIFGEDGALDELIVDGQGGADLINASLVEAGEMELTLRGGDGDDTLIGGAGNDLIIGGRGNDIVSGGGGDDTFIWNPGDGSDVVEGGTGEDSLVFNGANIGEEFTFSAVGPHLRLNRNIANIVMDCSSIELVELKTLGGRDLITVNDVSGTALRTLNVNLASITGTPDNEADTIALTGTPGNDSVTVSGTPTTGVNVVGLTPTVNIVGADAALDELIIDLGAGDDVGGASGLQVGTIGLTLKGGPGADVLIGSPGNDTLIGGEGDDILEGGPGLDILDGGPGANILIQD